MKIIKFKEKKDNVKENINIIEELDDFIDRFNILTSIKVGDKIGKSDKKYYIEETGRLQKFKRWWNGETRTKTFTYLDEDFTAFFKFCNNFKNNESLQNINKNKTKLLKLINDIIPGLYNLKQTYDEESDEEGKKLKCKIDSIIYTIIDLKEEVANMNTTSAPQEIKLFVPPESSYSSPPSLQSCSI